MSTHCALGIQHPDGKITGCYVHYDGATMKPRIKDFISKNTTTGLFTLIVRAQDVGGIRGFHSPRWPSEDSNDAETDLFDDYTSPYVIDETNFFDDHMGTFAWYLVNYETGEIEITEKY
jgi:hypothetical protein